MCGRRVAGAGGVHALAQWRGGGGVDRCRATQNGSTPLHWAAEKGHAAVVERLLAAQADKDAKNEVRGEGG